MKSDARNHGAIIPDVAAGAEQLSCLSTNGKISAPRIAFNPTRPN